MEESLKKWAFEPDLPGDYCIDAEINLTAEYNKHLKNPKKAPGQPTIVTALPYPEGAYLENVEGDVEFSVWITSHGVVNQILVLSEEPEGYEFAEAAAEAIPKEWRFGDTPAGRYRLKVRFKP